MDRIKEITDLSAPELDVYARLSENELRTYFEPEPGLFIAESPKVVLRALDAGYEPVSLLLERRHVETQAAELLRRCADVPVYVSSLEVLTRLTGFQLTRGVLCAMRRRRETPAETLLEGAHRVAVLCEVMNPTNVGAIFRSAAALGIDAVLLSPGCSDPLYRRAARVSMGTVFQVPWAHLPCSAEESAAYLRAQGFFSVAMALREDSVSIDDPRLAAAEQLAVLLGAEGDGLPDGAITGCDCTARIPMAHGVDSLNVAAAAAVIFWQLGRR